MRGKVLLPVLSDLSTGITPACAGKRTSPTYQGPVAKDHPRVCGEKAPITRLMTSAGGSPPRVRGKGTIRAESNAKRRITPACAGKSSSTVLDLPSIRDHPRVCGEKATVAPARAPDQGSPPRVRGKVTCSLMQRHKLRITPACAGKRSSKSGLTMWSKDHPRVCGEKGFKLQETAIRPGSPPRVRGKGLKNPGVAFARRITPACAGKS